MPKHLKSAKLLFLFCVACSTACPQEPPSSPTVPRRDLTQSSLEDLMSMEVTSASKKQQKISQTAAAIYVITQDDIRRSGMTSIPELLRMVPGMDVARINASNWAVSARGFNGRFANRLLVLIDGRSLYSPEFAGVFWQTQNLMLEDIDRIEVIRGPAATLYGANAVNGVINIITKGAAETHGVLATGDAGMHAQGDASVRYGASHKSALDYRFYGSYLNRGDFENSDGSSAGDAWSGWRSGFRADWQSSPSDTLMVEGDAHRDLSPARESIPSFTPPFRLTPLSTTTYLGGDVNARWTHHYSTKSETSLQVYYDTLSRDDQVLLNGFINILDVDFQHRFALAGRHDIVWGAEYRFTTDSTSASPIVSLTPASRQTNLGALFVQDEIALVPRRLWFTPGIKFETAPFTGFGLEPSGRLLWSINENHSVWISAAQSDSTPQRSERDLHVVNMVFPGLSGSLTSIDLFGGKQAGDQQTLDFEAGYRTQVSRTLSADLSTFYDHYSTLQTREPGAPFFSTSPVPHTVLPLFYANQMHGRGYGGEASLTWKSTNFLKVTGGYSFLRQIFRLNPGSQSPVSLLETGDNPNHQFQIRAQLNLPHHLEFDPSVYYVGMLHDQFVPAYTRVDTRLGWHRWESVDLDVVGQNLLAPRHLEFLNNTGIVPTLNPRRGFVRLTWRFSP